MSLDTIPAPRSPLRESPDVLSVTLLLVSTALLWGPLTALIAMALADSRYTHILLTPFACALLVWFRGDMLERKQIRLPAAMPLLLVGVIARAASLATGDTEVALALAIAAAVFIGCGIATLRFGIRISRGLLLLLLLGCVPPPGSAVDQVVVLLQRASAEITAILFRLAGTPVTRDGFVFSFQDFDVEVAEQCSGFRSAVSIVGSVIFTGRLFLQRGWARWSLVFLSVPVVIFKNAVRIAGISWLGLYVDPGFLSGDLHKFSGLPFSLVAVALLLPLFWGLLRLEARCRTSVVRPTF